MDDVVVESTGDTPDPEVTGRRSVIATLAKGTTWNAIGQFFPVPISLVMTPYVIHGLGLTTYGLYMFVGSATATLSTFDGGVGGAAQRYFAVLAGEDKREETTKLLYTLLTAVLVIGAALSTIDWFVSPLVVHWLHISHQLSEPAIILFRTLGVLITFSYVHGIFAGVVTARHRWSLFAVTGMASYLLWCGGMVFVIHGHYGLRGIAVVLVAQQFLSTILIVPRSFSYMSRKCIGFVTWSEVKTFASYAGKTQLSGISALVNVQLDALVIGAALSVRLVGIYDVGASFALQLRSVLINALSPTKIHLSRTFGMHGAEAAFTEMAELQRLWVTIVTGWSAVAAGATYFGITAWLGAAFRQAAVIGVILLIGYCVNLYTGIMTVYTASIGEPGIDARYGALGMVVNVVLTIALVITGPYGVVVATSAGQVLGSIYLMRLVRRRISANIPSFFSGIPYIRALAAGLLTVGLELLIRPLVPRGPLGLLLCAVPAAVALLLFVVATTGVRRTTEYARMLSGRYRVE